MWDPYNITVGQVPFDKDSPLEEIKILIPEGYRDVLSLDTATQARICPKKMNGPSDGPCFKIYRTKIRAMITKIPGPFIYMSYR